MKKQNYEIKFRYQSISKKLGCGVMAWCIFDGTFECVVVHQIEDFKKENKKEYERIISKEIKSHIRIYKSANNLLNNEK